MEILTIICLLIEQYENIDHFSSNMHTVHECSLGWNSWRIDDWGAVQERNDAWVRTRRRRRRKKWAITIIITSKLNRLISKLSSNKFRLE